MSDEPEKSPEEVVREDGRYPPEALLFLHEGLARAVRDVYGDRDDPAAGEEPQGQRPLRHVTGQQLCEGLRAQAIERWGLLARTVLGRWNIRGTIDFGNIVYLLIGSGHMKKTETDSIEDFRDVYDFETAFGPGCVFEAGAQP